MAIKGIKPAITTPYVLSRDPCRGPNGEALEGATVFMLRPLDGNQRAIIRDALLSVQGSVVQGANVTPVISVSINASAYEACRFGIVGWSNFTDEDGNLIPFEMEEDMVGRTAIKVARRSCIARIDVDDAQEIMREVMGQSTLSKAEEKKSDGESSQKNYTPAENAMTAPVKSSGDATPDAMNTLTDL